MMSEKDLEDWFVDELVKSGWSFEKAEDLPRNSMNELLLEPRLLEIMTRINAHTGVTSPDIQRALNEVKWLSASPESNKKMLNFFKYGTPIKAEKDRTIQLIKLFDYEKLSNNQFTVSRQITLRKPQGDAIRMDILLFVNGIPLVNIELKDPTSSSEDYRSALGQIRDYWKIPEYGKFVQIGVGSEQISKYVPIVPWEKDENLIGVEWREKKKDIDSYLDSNNSLIQLCQPSQLMDIIQNYLFVREVGSKVSKVLPRYIQYRASEKIVQRVLDNLAGKSTRKKGLVWHWQGSGKTLTMIFAANKLLHNRVMENPTIFFIVDRDDLQIQLEREMTALNIPKPTTISSIQELTHFIQHDEFKGKRGFVITLIHKFSPSHENMQEVTQKLMELANQKETLLTRNNIIGFIDEAHRTQYGILAAQMRKIIPNAFYFAFTGTPIQKSGHDTYSEFSFPPNENYLDRYFITDSINDGFTLPITYAPRLENKDKIQLKRDQLDAFFDAEEEEITEEIKGEIKKKLNSVNVFLENSKRIATISEDISNHFKENVDGRFKAMIVAASRKACVTYKRELDKLLPPEYSQVVMTYNPKSDSKEIRAHLDELLQKNPGLDIETITKGTIEHFHQEDNPRILIVTDMLLTGFDSKLLQTMYLDKPLKGYRLLQAVARTNRTMGEVKATGLVMDYVGILGEYKRALSEYAEEDIKQAIQSIDDLRLQLKEIIKQGIVLFAHIQMATPTEQIQEITRFLMKNGEKSKEFIKIYRKARGIFESLGSDTSKLDHLKDYETLTEIYHAYMRALRRLEERSEFGFVSKYFTKTLKMIQNSIEIKEIDNQLPEIEFGYDYLKKLEERVKNKELKAANIVFTLNRFVLVDRHRRPFSETIVQKVERLVNNWRDKVQDYESIYREGVKQVNEINKEDERREKLGFDYIQFGVLLTLERELSLNAKVAADAGGSLEDDVRELFKKLNENLFDSWQTQPSVKKEVESTIRNYLRKYLKWGIDYEKYDALYEKIVGVIVGGV
jgi:type I restriction enzyme R subunit